jgi:1-acyl-sn-glycerol-3-phosphate acyltransferase
MQELHGKSDIIWKADPIGALGKLAVALQNLVVCGAPFWFPASLVALWKRIKSGSSTTDSLSRANCAILGILLILIGPLPVSRSRWFQQSWIMQQILKYFRVQVRGTRPDPTRQSVYGMAPHGIIPFSLGLAAFGALNDIMSDLRIVTATATRLIPFFSHTLRLGGSIDASAPIVDASLAQGDSLGVTPGGIAEMYYGYPEPGCGKDEEFAVLNARKGFVRLAIKHGADLVPCFVFGASKLYNRVVLPKVVERVSNWMRVSLILFYGRLGLPVPFEVPLTYALGEAITTTTHHLLSASINSDTAIAAGAAAATDCGLPGLGEPSREAIDFLHNTFKVALSDTFDSHKAQYGWSHKTLRLV